MRIDKNMSFVDKTERHLTSVELRKHFGQHIRQYRTMLKLSQEEMADILGISSSFLGLVERGQRGMDILLCRKFSILTGISLNDLFDVPCSGKKSSDTASEIEMQILLSQISILIVNMEEKNRLDLLSLFGSLIYDIELRDIIIKLFQALLIVSNKQK